MQSENQDQQNNNGKIAKQFDENLNKLTALVGKGNLMPARKINETASEALVQELLKEEQERVGKEVKEDLKNLLTKYAELQWAKVKAEKELEATMNAKMKEFNEKAKAILGRIDGLDKKAAEYRKALKAVEGATNEEPNNDTIIEGE